VFDNLSRIQRNRELNGERGFTLIELLIVIVVLGILAAVVVFALGGVTGQSTVAACNSDAKTVSVAVSAYEASPPSGVAVGTIPANIAALVTAGELKSAPSATAYIIGLDANGLVTVQLKAADPGAQPVGTYSPVGPGVVAQAYEGSSPYAYPATGGTPPWPTSMALQNICAGA
jgi:general secretion pathway protein G